MALAGILGFEVVAKNEKISSAPDSGGSIEEGGFRRDQNVSERNCIAGLLLNFLKPGGQGGLDFWHLKENYVALQSEGVLVGNDYQKAINPTDGAPDDGTRSCPTNVEPSSYYSGTPYDYVLGLADQFHNVMHVTEQSLWNYSIADLVNIKDEGYIFERIYDRISQWADLILPRYHTLSLDYYSTKNLIRDLSLPVEKIDTCKNGCMLYWKDDINLDYYKFCGDARYKSTREQILTARRPHMPFLGTCH
ncbi:UNVERIFIED_CONTAM: hypothetical protein Sradi_6424700 [Sesamum radiatum]|uniref:Uncharacterized protein n=1 Tax=Sesamum radiatum TaxID=300843 RepID=A0AAW2K4G4_SESRA